MKMENSVEQKFRHLDLFSGIGGFALAASWVWAQEHEIVSFCEIGKFPQKILKKHWPSVPIHDDIRTLRGDTFGRINLVSGGFPCQPYSVAGKRKGKKDDRALWFEMLRIIKESNPDWVLGENVAGFVNMELDQALSDLESEGYETTAFIIPACAIGAEHQRDRVWIVANAMQNNRGQRFKKIFNSNGRKRKSEPAIRSSCPITITRSGPTYEAVANPNSSGRKTGGPALSSEWEKETALLGNNSQCFKWNGWEITESPVCRKSDGVSNRVDRINGLGNAIVPQVAMVILAAIKQIENECRAQKVA